MRKWGYNNLQMNIFHNVVLADYSTMHLGGVAAHLAEIHDRGELQAALQWADTQQLPVLMIGGGSNIYWRDEGFNGLVLVNRVMKYEDFAEDDLNHYLTVGAGESWDSVVDRSVAAGLTGIEALSLVPGTAGATPVQNVGAYGQEIAQTLVSIEAYDRQTNQFVTIPNSDCAFGYRSSRFKTTDKGRYFIMAVTLHLMKGNPEPPFYRALADYLEQHDIYDYTPATIREAVMTIRNSKLPNPDIIANNGSFFANPVIDETDFIQLQADYPTAPHWPVEDGKVKLPAAWLLDQAGFKDMHDAETGMATWPQQTLVLINEHARSTADLEKFKQKIIETVEQKFHITLQQEPEILP